jgi:hypothetical protein
VAGGATAGSRRAYRLDPATLPVRSPAEAGAAGASSFIIERDRAILRRATGAGPDFAVSVPVSAYRGVSVRIEGVGSDGDVCAHVELLHENPELTLPLLITADPEVVEDDWKAWGKALGLPLLLIGQDGSIIAPLGEHGVLMGRPKARRRHSYFAQRRPRFLTRRKVGRTDSMTRLEGREIIARR